MALLCAEELAQALAWFHLRPGSAPPSCDATGRASTQLFFAASFAIPALNAALYFSSPPLLGPAGAAPPHAPRRQSRFLRPLAWAAVVWVARVATAWGAAACPSIGATGRLVFGGSSLLWKAAYFFPCAATGVMALATPGPQRGVAALHAAVGCGIAAFTLLRHDADEFAAAWCTASAALGAVFLLEPDLLAPLPPPPPSPAAGAASPSPSSPRAASARRWGSVGVRALRALCTPPLSRRFGGSGWWLAVVVAATTVASAALPAAHWAGLIGGGGKLGLPLKVSLSLYAAVLLPAYLWRYGAVNCLYFSDVALLATVVGVWLESPGILSAQAVAVLMPQALWIADFVFTAVARRPLCGLSGYMFSPAIPLWLRGLSSFHGWLPLVLLAALTAVGYSPNAFSSQCAFAAPLLAASFLLSPVPPSDPALPVNINHVFGVAVDAVQTSFAPLVWLGVLYAVFCGLVYLPTHTLLVLALA